MPQSENTEADFIEEPKVLYNFHFSFRIPFFLKCFKRFSKLNPTAFTFEDCREDEPPNIP
ncbi:hypothetical protein AX17_006907 [Amanita inopinata Kibby_2008]|nr:hypothetical protein AX17_006907 [Amanita inopinata Kibby_2008]